MGNSLFLALSCTAAMIVYPVALTMEKKMVEFSFGAGYCLGWGAAFFFYAAATCMCLDDLVRTLARGPCACCRRNNKNSNNNTVTIQTSGV